MLAHYPRPKILNSIPLDAHAVIEASAGTGKTFAIENVVVELLLRDQAMLDEILVLTFTERAAAESPKPHPIKARGNPLPVRREGEKPRSRHPFKTCGRLTKPSSGDWIKLCHILRLGVSRHDSWVLRPCAQRACLQQRSASLAEDLIDGRALFSRPYKTTLRMSSSGPALPGEPAELLSTWLETKDRRHRMP